MADLSETEVLRTALHWKAAGHRVALATVVGTWGSSPRPAGSHLAVREDARFVGSVSGGCVEARVVQEALTVMRSGKATLIELGISHDEAWEAGLACGGRVEVFVEVLE